MTTAMDATALLRTRGLTKLFGGVAAVSSVDVEIPAGEIRALIGPNGSGKSTFINLLSGIYTPNAGRVTFLGRDISGLRPHVVTRRGISRTFQNIRLFRDLSVLDNVMIGYQWHSRSGIWDAILQTGREKRTEREIQDKARRACARVGIEHFAEQRAGELPYGHQRRVEIARALAAEPSLLLLDEPVAGMNAAEAADLTTQLLKIREAGISILLVEHNMRFVMNLADRITVLDHGKMICEGRPDEVQRNDLVIEAYLGRSNEPA